MSHKFGVKRIFSDYHDLLDDKMLDAVSVCVPTYLHHEVAVEAARMGKHVLCEKPLACNSELGETMIGAARKNQAQLYIGFQGRFSIVHNEAVQLLQRGVIGKPVSLHLNSMVPGPLAGSWYLKREKGGGALFDTGCHSVDFILHNFGEGKISDTTFERSTQGDVDTVAKVSFDLPGDVKALLEIGWWSSTDSTSTLTMEGESGGLSADLPRSRVFVKRQNGILGRRTNGFAMYLQPGLPSSWAEIREFVESVRRGQESGLLARGEDALKVLKTIEEAYRHFPN